MATWRGTGASIALAVVACASVLALGGCNSIYTESANAGAGIAGAAAASKVTRNAAVATGIGLGAVAAARAGVAYTQRVAHNATQERIAEAAGPLDVGAVASWSVSHKIPIEPDQHGRVTVSRVISTGALDCKEIVFSVDRPAAKRSEGAANAPNAASAASAVKVSESQAENEFYVASICRDGAKWKWASAEPATSRWGPMQ
ncbi:hypothetical protein C9I57_06150 [Trinickia symbiotica]|uniref:Lipoprotein n=1 Tax=Trinickia symbiotica TaxID=863227 RepID=A0A2T3XYT8_9BURK|nr:hypothetical protein C9I57_06150 [Trinickia symbiotica]